MDFQFTDQGEEAPRVAATEKFVQGMRSTRGVVAPKIKEIRKKVERNWNALSKIKRILESDGISGKKRRELEIQAKCLQKAISEDDIRLSEVSA